MTQKIIAQGAEAKIILSNDFIIKDRIKKSYRISELDKKIRERRTRSEAKLLLKSSKIINCPVPLRVGGRGDGRRDKTHTKIKIPYIKVPMAGKHLIKYPYLKMKKFNIFSLILI